MNIMETIIYLVGNGFRLYIISRLFQIFLNGRPDDQTFLSDAASVESGRKIRKETRTFDLRLLRSEVRASVFCLYYLVNSIGFLVFSWSPEIIILTNLAGTLLTACTYEGKWKQRILAVTMSMSLATICEDFVVYILMRIGTEHIVSVGITIANLLFFMIVLLIGQGADFCHGRDIPPAEWLACVAIPTMSMMVSAIVLDKCEEEGSVVLGEISLILMNLLVFFLLSKIQNSYQQKFDLQLLIQENKAYESQIQILRESEKKISALRHDTRNHLIALNAMAAQGECEEIQRYIREIYDEIRPKQEWVSTGNYLIDGILNLKLTDTEDTGAAIQTKICIPENLQIHSRDVIVILGNLLDNAIRALYEVDKPKSLNVVMKADRGLLHIQVINTCRWEKAQSKEHSRRNVHHNQGASPREEKNISFIEENYTAAKCNNKRYHERYAKHHGIGLKNVAEAVERHCGKMIISRENGLFCVTIDMFVELPDK